LAVRDAARRSPDISWTFSTSSERKRHGLASAIAVDVTKIVWAIFFRASLADFKRPSAKLFAVQAFDGCAAFRFIAHRYKCETSGLARFSIGYDLNLCNASKLFEDLVKVSFSDGE
jgi:hypothetical protein